ncbi:MAG: hypothetical protein WBP41_14520 [Saprospiraceae bacterium]
MRIFFAIIMIITLVELSASFVISSWEKYEKLFLDIRVNQPGPFLGEYFQWLAERLEQRMRENPRKPFYV